MSDEQMEKLIRESTPPTADFSGHKATLHDSLMEAPSPEPRASGWPRLWPQRTGFTMAFGTLALVFVLGGGTVLAADSSKPGDLLYGIDKGWESFRLAIAGSDQAKLDLKIDYADERVEELLRVPVANQAAIKEAVNEVDASLEEIDTELDQAKLALELGSDTAFDVVRLEDMSLRFRGVLTSHYTAVTELEIDLADEEFDVKLARVKALMDDEVNADQIDDGLIKVEGELAAANDAPIIVVNDQVIALESEFDLAPFDGRVVEIRGILLEDNTLRVHELEVGAIRLEVEDGTVVLTVEGELEQNDDNDFQMSDDDITYILSGALATADNLESLVGRTVEARATLDDDDVVLTRLETIDDDGPEVKLLLEQTSTDDSTDDNSGSNPSQTDDNANNGTVNSASDELDDDDDEPDDN